MNAWVITRYDDVVAALKDPRLSNAMRRAIGTAQLPFELREKMAPVDRFLSLWVLNLDGEEHHRLRVLLSKAFTPRAMDDMRPRIHQIARELLDTLQPKGKMDFVAQFARPLPIRVIGDMFGVPETDRELLVRWSKEISTFFEIGPAKIEVIENMTRSIEEFTDYLRSIVNENRRKPKPNILWQFN